MPEDTYVIAPRGAMLLSFFSGMILGALLIKLLPPTIASNTPVSHILCRIFCPSGQPRRTSPGVETTSNTSTPH